MRASQLLCSALLSLLSLPAPGSEPGADLIWYRPDYAPSYIVGGSLKGQGFADQRDAFITQALGEFRITQMVANPARLLDEMKRRDNACSGALIKTPEREKFVIFSEPIAELIPNGFITLSQRKPELQPYLNTRGELRLKELVLSGKFKISVAAERSYGKTIDAGLLPGRSAGSVIPFYAGDVFASGLFKMTREKTTDAIIGYPVELSWTTRQFSLPAEDFWFVPVEGETELIQSRTGCSRSATGQAVITRINDILRNGPLADFSERAYLEWLPAEYHPVFRRLQKASRQPGNKP